MTQARDAKGRFASGTGARTGQIKGIVERKARAGGRNALRNAQTNATGNSGVGSRGLGMRVSAAGQATVAGHKVGRGTAKTVSRKVSTQKLGAARSRFKSMPPVDRRQVTRGHRKYLGPVK